MSVIAYSPDELMHYGVLGMKWGVRHDRKRVNKISKKIDRAERKLDKLHKATMMDPTSENRLRTVKQFGKVGKLNDKRYLAEAKAAGDPNYKETKRKYREYGRISNKNYGKAMVATRDGMDKETAFDMAIVVDHVERMQSIKLHSAAFAAAAALGAAAYYGQNRR